MYIWELPRSDQVGLQTAERCRGQVVRGGWLWCRKSPLGHELEAGLHHAVTGKLSLSQPSSTSLELGKAKAVKGKGRAPPFIRCAKDTVGLYSPLPLLLSGYRKPLPLPGGGYYTVVCGGFISVSGNAVCFSVCKLF